MFKKTGMILMMAGCLVLVTTTSTGCRRSGCPANKEVDAMKKKRHKTTSSVFEPSKKKRKKKKK